MQSKSVAKRLAAQKPDEVICDRCGKVPGFDSLTLAPYCHYCMHECTFTRAELVSPARKEGS